MEEDSHASVLRAVHGEILAYGLRPVLCPEVANNEDSNTNKQQDATTSTHCMDTHGVSFVASAAGAFPPLRYRDGGEGEEGRVIVVRALTMFDELIVSAKVEEERGGASSGSTRSRRLKFDVSRWHDAWREEKKQQQQQPPPQQQPQEECQLQQMTPTAAAAPSKTSASADERESATAVQSPTGSPPEEGLLAATSTSKPRPSPLAEEFRLRVRSGLLFHLCPPSGQFADLFGVEEGLRRRMLGMLGAKGLATFGMTSRAADVSALPDSLWAPLVAAEFSEREQHSELFLRSSSSLSSPPPPTEASQEEDGRDTSGEGDGDGDHADGTAETDVQSVPRARTLGGSSSSSGGSSSSSNSSGGGVCRGARRKAEGTSRRLYMKLHSARVRRAAIAAEQRHRSSILEMGALGHLGRTWGLYPWAPFSPRDPYHAAGPAFPEYNWGPRIGPGGGGGGSGRFPGVAGGMGPSRSMWSEGGGGWGRRPGSRRFGGEGVGCDGGIGGGGGAGWADRMGVPPPSYGQGRRGRLLGQLPGR